MIPDPSEQHVLVTSIQNKIPEERWNCQLGKPLNPLKPLTTDEENILHILFL